MDIIALLAQDPLRNSLVKQEHISTLMEAWQVMTVRNAQKENIVYPELAAKLAMAYSLRQSWIAILDFFVQKEVLVETYIHVLQVSILQA